MTSAARSTRERSENDLAGRRPRLQGERSETAVAGLRRSKSPMEIPCFDLERLLGLFEGK